MTNTKFIILTSFILMITTLNAKVQNQTNPQACSKPQRQTYMSFYKKNFKTFDLFLANHSLEKVDCFYQVFLVDGVNKTVLWLDTKNTGIANFFNLYISRSNASELFTFETNMEIPLLEGSLNEKLIQEKNGDSQREDRVSEFLQPFIMRVLAQFDVNEKKKYFETLYLMNRINLDKLMNIMFADFFAVFLARELPFLNENFQEDLIRETEKLYSTISGKMHQNFQSNLDESVAQNTFNLVLKDEVFTTESYELILSILNTFNEGQNPTYGRNPIGAALNSKFNELVLEDLQNFMNDFEITVDKKKNLDYSFEVEGENDSEKFNFILNAMKTIPIYKIRFFLFEKFELISLKRNVRNGMSFNFFGRTPADNCRFTSNKLTEFLNLVMAEKVMDQSILAGDLNSSYVRCEKTVSGNEEYFKMVLKPNNDQECEVFVKQTDLGQNQYTAAVLLDTFQLYGSLVSCMRYSRGIIQSNMMFI